MVHERPAYIHPSPNGRDTAELWHYTELRMGWWVYLLALNHEFLGDRDFSEHCTWSSDGRYFAIKEWLDTSPDRLECQLTVIDLGTRTECHVVKGRGWGLRPLRFEGGKLHYGETAAVELTEAGCVSIPDSEGWRPLAFSMPRFLETQGGGKKLPRATSSVGSTSGSISPDGTHVVEFAMGCEVQMSVPFYYLCLDGRWFGERIFGGECVWSADSEYFAVDEWLSTDRRVGPDTQLLIVNVATDKACVLGRTRGGFVHPMGFEGATVAFRQIVCNADGHESKELRANLPDGENWVSIRFANPRVLFAWKHPILNEYVLFALTCLGILAALAAVVAGVIWLALRFFG
jgi:hypothetical protein